GAGDQRLDRARVEDVGRHGEALRMVTAAHWWDDRQLVAVLEDVVGADVLLVHHQHHGPGEAVEGRRIRQGDVVAIPGGAAFGNLELSLTGSKLLTEHGEEPDGYVHVAVRLSGGRSGGLVDEPSELFVQT